MALQGLAFIAKYWVEALAVGFIIFGILGSLYNIDDTTFDDIFAESNLTIQEKGTHFIVMGLAFNAITPSYRYELPGTDKYYVGLNDIPYFDLSDLIVLAPVSMLTMWFIRKVRFHQSPIWNFVIKLSVIIIVIMMAYLAVKFLQYHLYLNSATKLGIPRDVAINMRNNILDNTEQVSGILGIIAFIGGIGAVKKIRERF